MKGIKNFIAKLPGIRGFLRKWRNMLAEINALKKESAGLKKQITVLKKKNADFSGKVKQLNAEKKIMNTELTKADRQMKKLREDAAKGCLMADLARLQELQFERKTERMFWKADPSLEQSGELKHMEEIRFLEEKRPLVSIIRLDQNGKWNQDAETTESEYLLFVNKDTEITDGWLDELLIAMREADRPGAIGAKLVYPEIPAGMANEEKSYMLQHTGIGFKDVIREKAHFIQPYNMKNGQPDSDLNMELQERIAVSKNAMLIKKTVFDEIGGFDDRYIGEYADVDLCLRLYQAGYKNYYCPKALVYSDGVEDRVEDIKEKKRRCTHDLMVFKGKWQRYLAKQLFNDKISQSHMFTEQKLTIAFAVSDAKTGTDAEEYYHALFFGAALEALGCKVKILSRTAKKDWYNVGVDTDILVLVCPDYDIEAVYNCKNDLIRILWQQKDNTVCLKLEMEAGQDKVADMDCRFDLDYDLYDLSCMNEKTPAEKKEYLAEQKAYVIKNHIYEDTAHGFVQMISGCFDVPVCSDEIDICGAMPDDESKKYWGDQHFAVGMKKEFEKLGYKANVLPRDRWYDQSRAGYVIVLRGKNPYYRPMGDNRKYIMWNISHPDDVTIDEYNSYDYVFFASQKMHDELASKLHVPSGVAQQCVDDSAMVYEEGHDKQYELLFVGNSRHVFRPILKDLIPTEHKLTVYGRHWEKFPVQDYVVSDYMDNSKVGQAYHDAKILLNDHWDDMRENGIISNRIFDALAVGAFIISDDIPEIHELFGDNVVTYHGREDLKEKIDYYLKHEEERDAKAKAGQKIALNGHTFRDRVAVMVKVIREMPL
ncbi:glycosyltransferase [Clostridium sp. BIOML-A1]|uniref:glycosyltransferase family protein n=1 Tax=Clostridium sp. BIOML-A1 TaxID=2584627 RepID=UPI00136B2E84|nr:glycosyltransferase [Clostridium sp. BIOML-A1]MZH16885.1 glycosyltransferase [Clostridium sp. BIOML-A1]